VLMMLFVQPTSECGSERRCLSVPMTKDGLENVCEERGLCGLSEFRGENTLITAGN
jgi:hypothetical protein